MPKIRVSLSSSSVAEAIKELEAYQKRVEDNCQKIKSKVTEVLKGLVEEGFNGVFYDGLLYEGFQVPSVRVEAHSEDDYDVVIAYGKEAVFIEFGAGVYYNPSGAPHPDRGKVGVVPIGEYGHGYGKREVWGYYDEAGELHLTHGTPASMPMFYAIKDIVKQVPRIAKEVFKEGGG